MTAVGWGKLSPIDPSSYARPDLSLVIHAVLTLAVDFDKQVLHGNVLLDIKAIKDIDEIILDSSDLNLGKIELDGNALAYTLSDELKDIGSKLTIKLNETAKAGEILKVKINYETSPKARALQWLGPEQTSGKVFPYLFSQCQPIHARTILPCQDSSSVKFTYEASITAPAAFTVLMSALHRGQEEAAEGSKVHNFHQPVPVPSYLLALAVGHLESRKLGPRSSVWAEKAEVDKAAWEFAEVESMLQAAERLCGPYEWTRYDLLVLPPSFPYGGMENPCLTFVTPTLLAGDRSLADVIVHEIMHSWSGNLVTNSNFEHFWLNEGFTVFLERKVQASLAPNAEEGKRIRDFYSLLGLQELNETITSHLGAENPLTKLVVDLDGVHPDDAFSLVPYEKGSTLLRYLEDLLGGPSVFDDFLRSYIEEFKFQCLDTEQFKSYFLEYFSSEPAVGDIDWEGWFNKPGLPIVTPNYDTTMTKVCTELASRWHNEPISAFKSDDLKTFIPQQVIKFLQELLEQNPLPLDKLQAMGDLYKFHESGNCEIKFRWIRLGLKSKWEQKIDDALNFVNSQGRMKYVRPIYRDLYAWEVARPRALKNFEENKKYMMHVSAYTVHKDLHLI